MSQFFAYLSRMRHIMRWGLMYNTQPENIQEHSQQCAMLAHGLATLHNTRFGGQLDIGRVVTLAVFHEASEVITGDLPTPIKYHDERIKEAYKAIEAQAVERLTEMLPADLRVVYQPLMNPQNDEEWRFVKAADRLCVYIKCLEERKAGNREFIVAEESILRDLKKMSIPSLEAFMQEFLPAFSLTLDEMD